MSRSRGRPCRPIDVVLIWILVGGGLLDAAVSVVRTDTLCSASGRLNTTCGDSWVQYAPNGVLGMVYKQSVPQGGDAYICNLIYKTIGPDGAVTDEIVIPNTNVTYYRTTPLGYYTSQFLGEAAILLYDSNLRPHVFVASEGYYCDLDHYYKATDTNQWASEPVIGQLDGWFTSINGCVGNDGSLHLLALTGDWGKADQLLYSTNKTGTWQTDVVTTLTALLGDGSYVEGLRYGDLAIDAQGAAHIVYGVQIAYVLLPNPNPRDYSEVRYATNQSGAWVSEVALGPTDISCNAGWNPSIALYRSGAPAIVSTFLEQVPTLSAQYAQLRWTNRAGPGNWVSSVVANVADGYFGGDGGYFTGFAPTVSFDVHDRPHILFSDIASSHDAYGNFLKVGQIRYAYHSGTAWELTTLYRQPGTADYYNSDEMLYPCVGIGPGGRTIHAVGLGLVMRYDPGTQTQTYTYNLLHVQALNTAGTWSISGWAAPQAQVTFETAGGGVLAVVTARDNGFYCCDLVPDGWSGTIVPFKAGCTFNPPSINVAGTTSDLHNQNFQVTMPARVPRWTHYT